MEPNAAPLYVLVSKLNKRVAINTTIQWLEDVLAPVWTNMLCACTASATSISASDGIFNKYDVVKNVQNGEIFLVTAVSTTPTDLTVVRGYGTTVASAMAVNDDIMIIGSSFAEGSLATDLVTRGTQVSTVPNYLQIFRKSVEITRTHANTELYGGADRPFQRKKKGIELMADLERSFLYGQKYEDSDTKDTAQATYQARRMTGGALSFITTNTTDAGGALTEAEMEAFCRTFFRYGSNTRYLFAAPLILSVISLWAQGKLQMFPKDKTYGLAISQYVSPHGTLNLVKENQLEYVNNGVRASTGYYAGYAFALELEDIVYRYLQNRDVQMETDIQNPGDDLYKDQYICEVGMEFHSEKKHAYLYGVTS